MLNPISSIGVFKEKWGTSEKFENECLINIQTSLSDIIDADKILI